MQIAGLIWNSKGMLLEANEEQKAIYKDLTISPIKQSKVPPKIGTKSPITDDIMALVIHFESLHDGNSKTAELEPKMDPIGIWTVGYGIALTDAKGKFLKGASAKDAAYKHKLSFLTEDEYRIMLKDMLENKYLPMVFNMVGKNNKLSNETLGALTSFCYNCGTHYLNSKGVKVPFAIWNNVKTMGADALQKYWETSVTKAGGVVQPGLVRRRKSEAYYNRYHKLKFIF